MIKTVLIGSGNVAFHLSKAFRGSSQIDLIQRYSRDHKNDQYFDSTILKTNNINNLEPADIYVIAINDDAISTFSKQLTFNDGLVVHTSGSKPLNSLQCKANKGVFYPLQSFSKEHELNYNKIPICIETENKNDMQLLKSFANSISNYVYEINSQQREKLHIAAVFANNFSNHMFKLANDICIENNFSFEILKPLIFETTQKLNDLSPYDAQTGPAQRNDIEVIKKQLQQLDNNKKEIYNLVTKSIIKNYNS
ncbi:MAG: DUF2520 domain-containing protein [Bacteroidota bacterium]